MKHTPITLTFAALLATSSGAWAQEAVPSTSPEQVRAQVREQTRLRDPGTALTPEQREARRTEMEATRTERQAQNQASREEREATRSERQAARQSGGGQGGGYGQGNGSNMRGGMGGMGGGGMGRGRK